MVPANDAASWLNLCGISWFECFPSSATFCIFCSIYLSPFLPSHVFLLVFHPPACFFSAHLPLSIFFLLFSLPLSRVWPWGRAMSPERIEEKGEGAKKKETKKKNNSHVTHSSPPPSPAPHVSFLSLFVCVNEKLWRGEKESVSIGPLKDAAQAGRPPPHCEHTSHLYHTGKSITPGSERAGSELGVESLRRKTRRRRKKRRGKGRKVSSSSAEEGLREWLTGWHKAVSDMIKNNLKVTVWPL